MNATIEISARTQAHKAWLETRGYKVTCFDGKFVIEAESFVDTIDLSKGIEPLKEVIKSHKLLTYTTKITFPDGKVLWSVPACCRLGEASALVAKPEKAVKAPKAGLDLSGL